jgi:hypothetical protein
LSDIFLAFNTPFFFSLSGWDGWNIGGKASNHKHNNNNNTTFTFIDRRNIGNIGSSGYKGKGSHEKIRFLFLAHFFSQPGLDSLAF